MLVCSWCVTCGLLVDVCCVLAICFCLVLIVGWVLFVVCCCLIVACYLMFDDARLLVVGGMVAFLGLVFCVRVCLCVVGW